MSVRPLSVVGSARPFRPKRGRRPMKRGRTALKTEVAKPASLAIMTRTGADLRACERQISPRSFLSFLFCFRRESRSSRAAGGRRLHRPRDRRASSTSRFQSTRNAPPKRGISVVMESASRSLNLSSVKDADRQPLVRPLNLSSVKDADRQPLVRPLNLSSVKDADRQPLVTTGAGGGYLPIGALPTGHLPTGGGAGGGGSLRGRSAAAAALSIAKDAASAVRIFSMM